MSMLMVRPGPLEGGPMVSPGPAKESGEKFSAQLKHAYDQSKGASAPLSAKPSPNPTDQSERPAKENEASPKEAAPSKDARPAGSPRSSKGAGKIPAKGPETVSDGVPKTSVVDPALIENAETLVVAIPINLPLAVETPPSEKGEAEGDPDVSLLESIAVVGPSDLPVAPAEILEETPADSEPPKKEEPVKVEAKPQEAPTSALLPVNLAVVMPTEPAVPVENEIPLAPVASVKEDAVAVPLPAVNGSVPEPVNVGLSPAAGLDQDMATLPKTPELKNVVRPKDSPELLKKKTESSVPEAAEKTPVDRPDLRVVLDPVPQGIRPEPKVSVTHSPEKEVQRETHPVKEAPLPAVVFQPEVAAPIPLTIDAVPKPKESPGIAPIDSGMAAQSGPPAQGTTESVQNSAPVLEETPAKAGAKAGPVEIARQIHVHLESGRSVVRIDLHPEHLGELRISMETKGKDVSMQFTVDNENARTSVVAGLREITGTLSSLGWSVSGLAVNVSSGGVGNGRGESSGPLWGENRTFSNTLLPESKTPSPKSETGQWRVDLVA